MRKMLNEWGIYIRSGLIPESFLSSRIDAYDAFKFLDASQMKVEYDLKDVRMFTRGMIANHFLYILLAAHH